MIITDLELRKINEERRRKNLPRLTREQAEQIAQAQQTINPGFDVTSFLIGFVTGHGGFSVEGQLGAALYPREKPLPQDYGESVAGYQAAQRSDPVPASQPDPSPSYTAPDPAPSYDSSSSAASVTSDNGGNI